MRDVTRIITQLLLKSAWFSLVSMLAVALWLIGYNLFWQLNQPSSNPIIPIAATTGILFAVFLVFYVYVSKEATKALLRWTGKSLIILSPLMVLCALGLYGLATINDETKQVNTATGSSGKQGYIEGLVFTKDELLESTNIVRSDNSKAPLTLNAKLNASAQRKCEDMIKRNYWSHNSPDGIEPWHFINESGYQYSKSGENLAYGFPSENAVVNGWMNSELHRKNLMDDFTEVGFGICTGDNYVNEGKQLVVVQHFGVPQQSAQTPVQQQPQRYEPPKPYVAFVCTKAVIPHQSEYINDPNLYEGSTYEIAGWDGYVETCTPDSTGYKPTDFTSPAYNKKIYIGTKPRITE